MNDQQPTVLDLIKLVAKRRPRFRGYRQRLDRILHLAKTYPPRQVLLRAIKMAKNKLGLRYQPNIDPTKATLGSMTQFATLCELSDKVSPQNEISEGALVLLNEQQHVGFPIDWRCDLPSKPSHLWRFQLHYLEWLLPVAETDPDLVQKVVDQWIDDNRVEDAMTHNDAWHPYCISRRFPVLMKLLAIGCVKASVKVVESILHQIDYLAHNLETDLRGNHLLENYHALAMAGCFFEGEMARKWRRDGLAGLKLELEYQILDSGEHYERSPMYQCVICGNLLQLAIVSRGVDESLNQLAIQYARRMLTFLGHILCPDGEIPLLSDSCFGEGPSVEQLKRFATELGIDFSTLEPAASATIGNYWVNRDGGNMLLFDAGELAAKGLPGHAHCDLLNLVGSVNGSRLLVDSGNGSYDLDSTRAYCRSSVAHNVTTVDEMDHADVWAKFRMGFRGKPSGFKHGSNGPLDWAIAQHDTYRQIGVSTAKRIVISGTPELLWGCVDYFEKSAKRANFFQGYLHFDESITLSHLEDGNTFCISGGLEKLKIRIFGCEQVRIAKSLRCRAFGKCMSNYAIVYSKSTNDRQATFGWYLCDFESASNVELVSPSEIRVQYSDREYNFDLMNS